MKFDACMFAPTPDDHGRRPPPGRARRHRHRAALSRLAAGGHPGDAENTVQNGERPEELVIYGGTGQAARDWRCFDVIVESLRDLRDDETLVIQSGKPVARFRTHEHAPRVLTALQCPILVGRWANWETFHELKRRGLIMFGQYTAGAPFSTNLTRLDLRVGVYIV